MSKKSDADRAVTWLVGNFGNQSVDAITSNFACRRVTTPVVFFAALAVIVDEINNHLTTSTIKAPLVLPAWESPWSATWIPTNYHCKTIPHGHLPRRAGAPILDSVLIHSPHSQAPMRVATLAMPMAALWLEHPIMPHSYFWELNSECLIMSPSWSSQVHLELHTTKNLCCNPGESGARCAFCNYWRYWLSFSLARRADWVITCYYFNLLLITAHSTASYVIFTARTHSAL